MNEITLHASGTFEITLSPLPADFDANAAQAEASAGSASPALMGRMRLDKRYHGALQATAWGQMLSAMTPTQGSAGYVALEQVHGTLQGRRGSFVLQHSGLMNRGARQLTVSVVPDSGTGELAGLAGTLHIRIADGQHFYELHCTLPA